MPNEEWNKFGELIGNTRWFKGEPEIEEEVVIPVYQRWICPCEKCNGEMKFNGMSWPTGDSGYHHTCNICGFTAVITGTRYPKRMGFRPNIAYQEIKKLEQKQKKLEADILTLVGRLYGEDDATFAPETYDVMKRYRPVFEKLYLNGGIDEKL